MKTEEQKRAEDQEETRKTFEKVAEGLNGRGIGYVVDIGANHGEFFDHLADIGYHGAYAAIEPQPELTAMLEKKLAANTLATVRNLAVSDANGKLPLFVDPNFDNLSSLNPQSRDMNAGVEMKASFEVDVVKTDDLLADLLKGSDAKVFLKVDTQGHDYRVLKGIDTFWPRIEMIMTECSSIPLYEEQEPYWSVMRLLADQGFVPIRFQPITRRFEQGVVLIAEFDGVFVRRHVA